MNLAPVTMADHGLSRKQSSPPQSQLSSMIQWLQKKKYQFEVMLPLYMLTHTERIVFYVISFTLISMFWAAAYFYLPNHISIISNRVYYYMMGELSYMSSTVGSSANGFSQLVRKTSGESMVVAAETAAHAAAAGIRHGKEL